VEQLDHWHLEDVREEDQGRQAQVLFARFHELKVAHAHAALLGDLLLRESRIFSQFGDATTDASLDGLEVARHSAHRGAERIRLTRSGDFVI
jgi:hypothetical protein